MRILSPPTGSDSSEELFELIWDLRKGDSGNLIIDERKEKQAVAIAVAEGEEAPSYKADLIKHFLNVYKPDEALLFLCGQTAIEEISKAIMGRRLIDVKRSENAPPTEEKKKELTRKLIENILYLLVRRRREAEKFPAEIPSEEVKLDLRSWIDGRRSLPNKLPYIPEYQELFEELKIEVQKNRSSLGIEIRDVEAKLLREAREQAIVFRESQEQAIAGLREELAGTRNEIKLHNEFISKRIAEFQNLVLGEWRVRLKIDKRIEELRVLYKYFEDESYEFLAGVDRIRESLELTGILHQIDYSFIAIGLSKAAELELQRKLALVLDKLRVEKFCTKKFSFVIKKDSKNRPYINLFTIKNAKFAIIQNKEKARKNGWKPANNNMNYDYIDTNRLHSVWTDSKTIELIENLGTLRNNTAHTEKFDQKMYDEMQRLVLDGSTGLVARLRTLGMTREEEEAETQGYIIQRTEEIKRDNKAAADVSPI